MNHMLQEDVLSYLKQSKASGLPFETIEATLRQQGRDEAIIQEAKTWYATASAPTP